MKNKYTNETNIQMFIYLLKENGIKNIIINPGTMNMSLVASLQNDDFFKLYSCVDERSACYMACGLAAESNEPVVLTCTGATASRNYMPGLTEAFYRKLPILCVTCTPHLANIGQNIPQMIDRRTQLNDTYKFSTYISPIKTNDDLWNDTVLLNKAILELNHNGKGPVHINLGTEVTRIFIDGDLPKYRCIKRYTILDDFPDVSKYSKIGIFIGNHEIIREELQFEIEKFCEKHNCVVICDHTSNYFGKYKINANIVCDQEKYKSNNNNFDLIIHIGNVSGAYMNLNINEVWRVNIDGEIRDTFRKLTKVFEMEELCFFKKLNEISTANLVNNEFYEMWASEYNEFKELALNCDLPFSNPWIAQQTFNKLSDNSVLHLAILNSLRSWNYFDSPNKIECYCNTGGFGIDGIMSTMIGASLANNDKNYYCVIGDLAFFYDMNSLGNRHVGNNIRILLINNGCGTEFHNYSHPAHILKDENISNYIAADGHFGNKSNKLVKNYVEALGFEYISASSKEEYLKNVEHFTSNDRYEKPIVFEVFTNSNDESESLLKIRSLKGNVKGEIKSTIKKVLSPELKASLKKIIKK